MLPYWQSDIIPDLAAGKTVLVTAHGNSLRALVKHLDGICDDDIAELNIPTGIPLVYRLGDDFMPLEPGRVPRPRGRCGRCGRRGGAGQEVASPTNENGPADVASAGPSHASAARGGVRRFSGSQSPVARYCTFLAIETAWSANRSW